MTRKPAAIRDRARPGNRKLSLKPSHLRAPRGVISARIRFAGGDLPPRLCPRGYARLIVQASDSCQAI